MKEKSRHIDELLILSLFKNQDEEIINELKKYQNADGGFGHCLEPDVRMPDSSVLATTRAVIVLHEVKEKRVKIKMIEDIVHYFESQYDNDRKGFYMVSKEVNNYPRAVWWNYEDIDKNLWVGLDNGINCINLQSPVHSFTDETGVLGTVYTSKLYHDLLYIGTNQGLFYKNYKSNQE